MVWSTVFWQSAALLPNGRLLRPSASMIMLISDTSSQVSAGICAGFGHTVSPNAAVGFDSDFWYLHRAKVRSKMKQVRIR